MYACIQTRFYFFVNISGGQVGERVYELAEGKPMMVSTARAGACVIEAGSGTGISVKPNFSKGMLALYVCEYL